MLSLGLGAAPASAVRVRIRSRSTSASPPSTASIKRPVLVPLSAHGSANDRNCALASTMRLLASERPSLHAIFGSPDDMKFRSCMTLFSLATDDPENPFRHALNRWCGGRRDEQRWRLSMLADELIDAGQSLPDRTGSAEIEVRQ